MFRSIRILVTRSQECLTGRFQLTPDEREEQLSYFRRVRRQMTDDICATVPACLGHAPKGAFNSDTILLSAYTCIWPLYFAGICALERLNPEDLGDLLVHPPEPSYSTINETDIYPDLPQVSAAQAQVSWIWGPLNYISDVVGLKWAQGVAGVLKGDFRLYDNLVPSSNSEPVQTSGVCVRNMYGTSWAQRMRVRT